MSKFVMMTSLQLFYKPNTIEAGLDEAGRGCLAGPVVAAAVILPHEFSNSILNDSKQLKKPERDELRKIIEKEAVAYGIGILDNNQIDDINILRASFKAMNIAVSNLKIIPQLLLVDGNRFYPEHDIEFKCIVKGDAKFASIAAASILAKTYRDEFMEKIHIEHPQYVWNLNKGYPTQAHRNAIREYGITPYHRKSFRLLNDEKQMELDF